MKTHLTTKIFSYIIRHMHFLYRHYSNDGTLLYVGLSANVIRRHKAHRTESQWFNDVQKVTFEMLEVDKKKALEAERKAIFEENPKFNTHISKDIDSERSKVIDMKKSGMTWAAIGKTLGVSRQTASNIGNASGLLEKEAAELRRKKTLDGTANGYAQTIISSLMHDHGLTQVEIAEQVGCTQSALSSIYRGTTKSPGYDLVNKLVELKNSKRIRRRKAA